MGGGLLHSHVQHFPTGSQQQQVTCYQHKDSNNDWYIKRSWTSKKKDADDEGDHVDFVKHGDIIRLMHSSTKRNLHSHKVDAPVTKGDWEVSCYGNSTSGDQNDHWKVEIVDVGSFFFVLHNDTSSFLRRTWPCLIPPIFAH